MSLGHDFKVTGTLAAANDTVSVSHPTSSTVAINLVVTGTNATVFEATVDEGASPTWVAVSGTNANTGASSQTATASGLYRVDVAGYSRFRVRCSTYSSGSVTVTLNASVAPSSSAGAASGIVTTQGNIGGFDAMPSFTLTRPANSTPYTAQDEVATTGTAPTSATVSRTAGQTGFISGAGLTYSSNPSTTPAFRLLLFSATVTAAGDNAALALSDTDAAKYLGAIDFTVTQAGGSASTDNLMMSGAPVSPIVFNTDTVFALLITTNAFTPVASSETIKVFLNVEQN